MADDTSEIPEPTPEASRKTVRLLLWLTPAMAIFCLLFPRVQGASWPHSFLIAGVGVLMTLGMAGLTHLRGSKAMGDLAWIAVILRITARR